MTSAVYSTNPKDQYGARKAPLSLVPPVALAHEAHAMSDGEDKYGAYNWREEQVGARVYVDACRRHLDAWFEGEETASDSGVHHLGHARACLAILLDAQAFGNLVDDRPQANPAYARVMEELREKITARAAEHSLQAAPPAAVDEGIDPATTEPTCGALAPALGVVSDS